MKARLLLFAALAAVTLPACDRKPPIDPEAMLEKSRKELDDVKQRLAEMQEKERLREQQTAAAQVEQERQALAAERAKLEQDRAQLDDAQRRAADQRLAQIREEQRANEKQDAERKTAQRQMDQRETEQRIAAERADAAREAQQQARTEQKLDFFYDALDPHGDWVELDRYGYCWQPTAARDPGWRPYLDGHWVYTNYGWTWTTQEPFGWATYHYGRWTRVRSLGWVWVPGSEWAPAWVSWRSSDRYVGWAPLPPEAHSGSGFNAGVDSYYDIGPGTYNFVEVETMGAPTYLGRVVEPERNITVINQTTNVTNITYQRVDNHTVLFNDGPQFADIEQHSKVRRMELERVSQAPLAGQQRGNVLQLLAPFILSAAKPAGKPTKVREQVRSAEVERGWSGDTSADVTRVREQQKQEARKAEQAQKAPVPKVEPARQPAVARPVATPAAIPRQVEMPRIVEPRKPAATPFAVQPPKAKATPLPERTKPSPAGVPATPAPRKGAGGIPAAANPESKLPAATPQPGKLAPRTLEPATAEPPAPGGREPAAPRVAPEQPRGTGTLRPPTERPVAEPSPKAPTGAAPAQSAEPPARRLLREPMLQPGATPKPAGIRPARATPAAATPEPVR